MLAGSEIYHHKDQLSIDPDISSYFWSTGMPRGKITQLHSTIQYYRKR